MSAAGTPDFVFLSQALHVVVGAGLAAICLRFYRLRRRPHLGYWAASFFALALSHGSSFFGLALAGSDIPDSASSLLGQTAAYLYLALLLLGAVALREQAEPSRAVRRIAIGAVVVLALGLTVTSAWAPQKFMLTSLPHLLGAGSYLAVAALVIGRQRWRDKPLGWRIVALAFVAGGALGMVNFLASAATGEPSAATSAWVSLLQLSILLAIAAGLLIGLYDEESERAGHESFLAERLRSFDDVTGLPNRNQAIDLLAALLPELGDEPLVVYTLELDRLDLLRDSLDEGVLRRVMLDLALRIEGTMDPTRELIARLENNRFLLSARDIPDDEHAERRAAVLLKQMREPFVADGKRLHASLSIGAARYPRDGRDAQSLVRTALLALGRMQADGGNGFRLYAPEFDRRARSQLELQTEVRRALDRGELLLHFQPVVDANDHAPRSFEALLRWQHPRRGLLAPGAFLHAIEDIGAMQELDHWVLRQACRQLATWRERGLDDIVVAVNISAPTFEAPEFPQTVLDQLTRAGVPPACLEIEITEETAVRDLKRANETLARLRALGVTTAIDDFGVGFSSLSQLKHLTVDKLKIDLSFTASVADDPKTAAIVGAMITLAHNLGLRVVAEGVETDAQVLFYRRRDIYGLQGYRFHAGLPAADAALLLTPATENLRQQQ